MAETLIVSAVTTAVSTSAQFAAELGPFLKEGAQKAVEQWVITHPEEFSVVLEWLKKPGNTMSQLTESLITNSKKHYQAIGLTLSASNTLYTVYNKYKNGKAVKQLQNRLQYVEDKLEKQTKKVDLVEKRSKSNSKKIHINIKSIHNNTKNIHNNTEKINNNTGKINNNTGNIHINAEHICTNAENIHTNRENIRTNRENIRTNTENVRTNAEDINKGTHVVSQLQKNTARRMKKMEENFADELNRNKNFLNRKFGLYEGQPKDKWVTPWNASTELKWDLAKIFTCGFMTPICSVMIDVPKLPFSASKMGLLYMFGSKNAYKKVDLMSTFTTLDKYGDKYCDSVMKKYRRRYN